MASCSLDPHVRVTTTSSANTTLNWQTVEKRDDVNGMESDVNVCYIYSVGLIFAWMELLSWCVVVGFSLERWRSWLWYQHLSLIKSDSQATLTNKTV